MSAYTRNQIKNYGIHGIKNILPLDDETLSQMVDYAINELHSRDAVSQHFMNLIGQSPDALYFITRFSNMIFGDPNPEPRSSSQSSSSLRVPPKSASPSPDPTSRPKASAPKVLKIVSGKPGQRKKVLTTKIIKKKDNQASTNENPWDNNNKKEEPTKAVVGKARLSNNPSSGSTTSELLDKKPSTQANIKERIDFNKKNAQKKLNNLKDLDAALTELETVHVAGESSIVRRVCNCNATRHPLFEMFPNCLNCGKIICIKEGLQPCSFCGKSLLSNEERLQILQVLKKEKEELEGKKSVKVEGSNNTKPKKKNKIKISISSTGQDNFKIQDQVFKRIEIKRELEREKLAKKQKADEEIVQVQQELDYYSSIKGKDDELIKAQERLDTLLNFQDNGTQRTKIIDQASDFDAPTSSTNLWASPLERALQLKRQQKQLRRQEDSEKERSGRGKRVMDLSIRDGKAYIREASFDSEEPDRLSDDEEIKDLEGQLNIQKMKQFHENTQKNWDYAIDAKRFTKPLYIGKSNNEDTTADDEENKENDLPALGKVVQLGDEEEQENAMFTLVGI